VLQLSRAAIRRRVVPMNRGSVFGLTCGTFVFLEDSSG